MAIVGYGTGVAQGARRRRSAGRARARRHRRRRPLRQAARRRPARPARRRARPARHHRGGRADGRLRQRGVGVALRGRCRAAHPARRAPRPLRHARRAEAPARGGRLHGRADRRADRGRRARAARLARPSELGGAFRRRSPRTGGTSTWGRAGGAYPRARKRAGRRAAGPCSPSAACSTPARARGRGPGGRGAPRRGAARGPPSRASWSPTTSRSTSSAPPPYVSRGGVKLANALDALGVDGRAGGRSTSAPRPAGSPTACCSAAPPRRRGRRRLRRAPTGAAQRRARDGPRARQRPRARSRRLPCRARTSSSPTSRSSRSTKVLPAVLACAPPGSTRSHGQAAVRGRARAGREGRRGARPGAAARGDRRRRGARGSGARRARASPLGAARAGRQPRDVRVAGRGRAARAPWTTSRRPRARWTVIEADGAHPPAGATPRTLGALRAAARRAASTLRFDADETRKHGLEPPNGIDRRARLARRRPLRRDGRRRHDPHRAAPVRGHRRARVRRQLRRGRLPRDDRPRRARRGVRPRVRGRVRDARAAGHHRRPADGHVDGDERHLRPPQPGFRVADLAYALTGEEIGRVRCDGLVVSTPQGSTGYNLANGGPGAGLGRARASSSRSSRRTR